MNANGTWNTTGTPLPNDATVLQKLGQAVRATVIAGGKSAWLPWRLRLFDEYVELLVRTGSSAPDDTDDRHAIIQCGAALFHLKLALKHLGNLGRVELFPDLAGTGLVARIHSGFTRANGMMEQVLFETMTNENNPFASTPERPVDDSVIQMLQNVAPDGKAWLEFSRCESSHTRLVELADSGGDIMADHGQPSSEHSRIAQWAKPFLTFIVRTGDDRRITVQPAPRAEEMTALATIKTKTDDKHGWLATGQMLACIKLQTKALGISSHIFDRLFQQRRVREELRTRIGIGHKGFVQTIIGLGLRSAQWSDVASAKSWHSADFEADTSLRSYRD